jgi:hypothetical protein
MNQSNEKSLIFCTPPKPFNFKEPLESQCFQIWTHMPYLTRGYLFFSLRKLNNNIKSMWSIKKFICFNFTKSIPIEVLFKHLTERFCPRSFFCDLIIVDQFEFGTNGSKIQVFKLLPSYNLKNFPNKMTLLSLISWCKKHLGDC